MADDLKVSGNETPQQTAPKKASLEYPYAKSEKVWIHRVKKKPVLPEIGVIGDTSRDWSLKIGASFAGPNTSILLGRVILTVEEEKKYMPLLVGVQPTHNEWDRILDEYWANLQVEIPYDGKELEVGMMYKSDEIQEPINLSDWILYKYCLRYPQVANSLELAGESTRIRFYLFKEGELKAERERMKKIKDTAILARMELEKDDDKMQSLIILSGNALPATIAEQQMTITQLAEAQPAKFLELYNDKKLLEKAFVERLIRVGIFTRPINSTIVIYDDAQIGANLTEAVVWLNQPTNSNTMLALRQQLKDKEAK